MAVINTNVKALFSQNALTNSGKAQSLAMQQLSTGKRINSARDDAAGMAIATRMTQQIRGLNQAVRNAGDAINLIQTAEGATNEITDMMQRMRELAIQAVNDTNDNAQRSYLDLEFQQLKQQIVQISNNTEWNGFPVLNGTAGERVGEMPVFKVTSENQFGSVFINPTTSRTVAGTDSGEVQTILIAGTMPTLTGSETTTISVGGVDVVLNATTAATATTVATQIQQTLSNNAAFDTSSGRTVTVSGATLTFTYAASDGDVSATSFDPKAATGITSTVSTTRDAITQGSESFKANGAFLNSGALTMSADTAGAVTASFETSTGETIAMQGILNNSAVTETSAVTFNAMTSGQSITLGGLTYTATAANTAAQAAAAFASLSNGATTGVTTYGSFSGTLSGFASGAVSTSTVTFTSASTGTNVTNMPISGSGTLPSVVVTQGAPAGSITFIKDSGSNAKVISDDLVYTFKESDSTAATLSSRAFSYSVSVEGSIPALRAGDLKINGIDIGASYATDDKVSPVGNAAGSAIAKAAAINRMSAATGITQGETQMLTLSGTPAPGVLTVAGVSVTLTALDTTTAAAASKIAAALQASTLFAASTGRTVTYTPGNSNVTIKYAPSEGNMPETVIATGATGLTAIVDTTAEHFISSEGTGVFAKVNENVMTGRAMSGTSVVKGTVFINGYASADITTVLNNSRETRANVVRAINLISDKTGVKAIDTGVDAKGITLTAADGRNIEVSFETNANADDFGSRIGLRKGVQSSTISLESKIPAPVVLTSDSTGDIKRAGLITGNFSKNEAVANTAPRTIVGPNVAQVESIIYSGTVPAAGDTFALTLNGTTFTYTANSTDGLTTQAVRNGLVALVNANTTLPVTATAGRKPGEILLTADTAGTSFTLTNSKSNATTTVTATTLKANAKADYKPLGLDDLVINGVKIPASSSAGDIDSSTVATSSDPASSAIAIAAAINSQTPLTGVLAKANGAEIKGTQTVTSLPVLSVPTFHSLFINGTEVEVQFVQNESTTDRLTKVAEAINQRTGAHGVTAVNNGDGISLKSDGRNLAAWFDSNVKDLSAANFGLDQGGAVAQSVQISSSGTYATTDTASVTINGVQVTSAAAGTATAAALATALETAVNAAITSGALKNISVSRNTTTNILTISSTVAGSPFDINGANMGGTSVASAIAINEVTANSYGSNQITGIRDATATSSTARTVYGTVRMIAQPPNLPGLPKPIGAPPSELDKLLLANAKPFIVSSGADGFSANSNFSALGFNEGSYGGRSSSDMDPPKVGRLAFQVGSSANQTVTIDLADFGQEGPITGEITGDVDKNVEQRTVRINTREGASDVLTKLDSAMDKINATRATMGAVMNRLDHVINNLTNVSMNLSASRSGIEDADYAASSTELAKTQIMQQAATAVLAQANTSQQTVLKLLGG
jgi:flagellin